MRGARYSRSARFSRSALVASGGGGDGYTAYWGPTALYTGTGGSISGPAEHETGDLQVMLIFGSGVNTGYGTIAGWTKLEDEAYVSSGWAEIYWRIAGASSGQTLGTLTGNDRLIGQIVNVKGATAVDTSKLGYSNKSGWSFTTPDIDFTLGAHSAGYILVFGGGALGVDQPASTYSRGTEVIDYYTTGGNNYALSAGGGETDGTAVAGRFDITNVNNSTHCFGGVVVVT